ncbi:hypothetical protein I4U23_019590 [Adineta vaga]|nr:hypothetical protein I4U23_019590 [Adineta vaga]
MTRFQTNTKEKKPNSVPLERYRQEALAQHNLFRAQCKAEPLQQNKTLDDLAQSWCEKLASKDELTHSGTIEHGETSYRKCPFDFARDNGATPVSAWFNEKPKYNSTNPESALHFTQVVWKSTRSFGLGVCNTTNNCVLFVAKYFPRGNYKDQFAANIDC